MVEEIKDGIRLTAWIQNRWEKPSTLALALSAILVLGLSFSYQYDLPGIAEQITWQEILVVLSIMALVSIGWLFSTRLPDTPADRIGILIAIDCETKKERQRLKTDFVNALRQEMMQGNHQQYVVHELSEHRSRMIGSPEQAAPILRQTGSHLMVYGRCKVRTHANHPTYVLELNASVRHAPITPDVSRQFSKDMDLAFPRKALIPENQEFLGFELAKDLVGLASRFILGIASFISGNPVSAFDLHHGVWIDLKKKEAEGLGWPQSTQLSNRVATVLVMDGLNAANLRFTKKPPEYLADMRRYLDVVQEIDPNNYNGHLLKGIYLFLSRDIESAKKRDQKGGEQYRCRMALEFSISRCL